MASSTLSHTLLVELLTEELPPKSLKRLGESFRDSLFQALVTEEFLSADAHINWFATPRRLAIQAAHTLTTQADKIIERKGPAVSSGLDAEGKPTKALEGFMRSANVEFAQLERIVDGKAEYFVARIQRAGERLEQCLPRIVEAALKRLPIAKLMRWGTGQAQFVRPVHGLIMLHGDKIIPGEVLGLSSGKMTRGHRFLCPLTPTPLPQGARESSHIVINNADEYESTLEETGKVIASFANRRHQIQAQLKQQAATLNAVFEHNDALLDEVTALVEYPAVYVGTFEAAFLSVPQECLILTMQQNQKYFPLFDAAGKLLPHFLMVSNMPIANPAHIIQGNERVVRPRLADARFFFDQDRKTRLEERIPKLAHVIYHNKLGTQLERIERIQRLAVQIAQQLKVNIGVVERAAWLCKADLLTNMVGEFPELQGTMGRYYALHDKEPPEVAQAIQEHYYPRFAGDALPQSSAGIVLALADKLYTLSEFFGAGLIPTGDKDPFGLRRAALGIVRILIEKQLALPIHELDIDPVTTPLLYDFILERLRGYLRDQSYSFDTIESVLSSKEFNDSIRLDSVIPKLNALVRFKETPEGKALIMQSKRINNILKQAPHSYYASQVLDPGLLSEVAEKNLYSVLDSVNSTLSTSQDYDFIFRELATLSLPISQFFDDIMVMVEDIKIRENRIRLLTSIQRSLLNYYADFSKLAL